MPRLRQGLNLGLASRSVVQPTPAVGIHLRNGRGRHWTGWGQLKAPLPGRAVVEAESRVQ